MASTTIDAEVQKAPQSVEDWLKYVEEEESWQKVEKKRRKVKKIKDSSYFVISSPVGKELIDQPIIGGASGPLGSAILIGYNLTTQVGTGLTGFPKSGTSSSAYPDSADRSILPHQLYPDSLVNQGLDLDWTSSVTHPNPDDIYKPSGKPVYPHRLPLYESKFTLVNQDKDLRQENHKPWNTLEQSRHKPWVIII